MTQNIEKDVAVLQTIEQENEFKKYLEKKHKASIEEFKKQFPNGAVIESGEFLL